MLALRWSGLNEQASEFERKIAEQNNALEAQVARCDANLATKLFPAELSQLVEHLDTNYYKFSQ